AGCESLRRRPRGPRARDQAAAPPEARRPRGRARDVPRSGHRAGCRSDGPSGARLRAHDGRSRDGFLSTRRLRRRSGRGSRLEPDRRARRSLTRKPRDWRTGAPGDHARAGRRPGGPLPGPLMTDASRAHCWTVPVRAPLASFAAGATGAAARGEVIRMIPRRGLVVAALALVMGATPAAGQSPSRIPRIGYMSGDSGPNPLSAAFLQGLRELG